MLSAKSWAIKLATDAAVTIHPSKKNQRFKGEIRLMLKTLLNVGICSLMPEGVPNSLEKRERLCKPRQRVSDVENIIWPLIHLPNLSTPFSYHSLYPIFC